MGAWIETEIPMDRPISSLVAPFVGAWIETDSKVTKEIYLHGRSLRGSVD